jgi:hypothetical protein
MKTTNKIILSLFVLVLIGITVTLLYIRAQISFLGEQVGSGNIITEHRQVEAFHAISVIGNFNVTLYESIDKSLSITADDDLIELISTKVIDQELQIGFRKALRGNKRIDIDVYFNNLYSIEAEAGAKINNADTIYSSSFRHSLNSGAQSILILRVDDLELESVAGSRAELKGFAGNVIAKASSGAQIRAYDLAVQILSINASSGANVQINVEQELSVKASSGSNVRYKGSPVLKDFSTSGGANVRSL